MLHKGIYMGNGKVLPLVLIVSVRRRVLTIRHCVRSSLIVPESVVVVLVPLVVGAEGPGWVAPGGIATPLAREKERVDSPVFHHVKLAMRCGHTEGAVECIYVPPPNGTYEPCSCVPAPVTPAPVRGRVLARCPRGGIAGEKAPLLLIVP